jgi:hypothetical protein
MYTLSPITVPILVNLYSASEIGSLKKPNEYHTLEFGTIYNNTVSSILEQPEEQSARFVNWTNRNIKID